MQGKRIGSSQWVYMCDDEYLEEFNKRKMLKYSLLLAVLPRNRLDIFLVYYV